MTPPRRALGVALAVAVAAAIVAGFLVVGGPGTARLERLDDRRARDTAGLVRAVDAYRADQGRLPESLAEIEPRLPADGSARDPASGEFYAYEIIGPERFRICTGLALPDRAPPAAAPIRIGGRRAVEPERDKASGTLCWDTRPPDR